MDGRPNRKNKAAFSNFFSKVWTGLYSLGEQQLELSTRTRSFLHFENAANFSSMAASSKQFFFADWSIFELGSVKKIFLKSIKNNIKYVFLACLLIVFMFFLQLLKVGSQNHVGKVSLQIDL